MSKEENWEQLKQGNYPDPDKRVHLKLYAEYKGHYEPPKKKGENGSWVTDHPPLVNESHWRYLEEEE